MQDILLAAAGELAVSSPFALLCIVFVWLLNRTHARHIKDIQNAYDKNIEDIKELYKDVYSKLEERNKP